MVTYRAIGDVPRELVAYLAAERRAALIRQAAGENVGAICYNQDVA